MEILLILAFIVGAFYIILKEKRNAKIKVDYSKDSL